MDPGSISRLFQGVADGNPIAQEKICEKFLRRLTGLVRKRLNVPDPEDVALSVLGSFLSAVKQNRFPRLSDRNALWTLLAAMVAIHHFRSSEALVRGDNLCT
jgi:hypothetical protein